ncbi:acid protease [Whalleya microplaca]|nr:acid protease [Whalleya microplaca]
MMFFNLFALAGLCLAASPQRYPYESARGDVVTSLSLPGLEFRTVKPITSTPVERKVQNYLDLKRVPHSGTNKPQRSAASLFGQIHRGGSENITVVDHRAIEYAVEATFNGVTMNVIIDTGSADTWVKRSHFTCKDNMNTTISEEECALGPSFTGNFSGKPITDQHFDISYGDGETVQGRLGYMDIEFANITVKKQEVALASQGTWNGNNFTSGILGLAYPSLTNAYWGNDLDDDSEPSNSYSPFFTSLVSEGFIEPYFVIALDRNSSAGSISVGGMPPVDLDSSYWVETPILIAKYVSWNSLFRACLVIDKDSTSYQPSFYTIVPEGFKFGQTITSDQYPFVLDTGTTLIYLPPDLADAVNAQFDPPATYVWHAGAYFTDCDAIPPSFGVQISASIYWVSPKDMINREMKDPDTGLCSTAISTGGSGPYILGAAFLTNVVVMMNVGMGRVELWSHQFY